jgi:hypothetical protein
MEKIFNQKSFNNFFTLLGCRVNLYLPPISTTPAVLGSKFVASVVDTSGEFSTGGTP